MTEQCKYWDSEIKTCRRSDVPKITLPEHIILDDLVSDEFKVVRAIDLPEPKIENRWIPVTERLPKDARAVLLTIRRMDKSFNQIPFISVGYISWNQQAWWCAHDGDCKENNIEVLAWMPLPEPWKGDEE